MKIELFVPPKFKYTPLSLVDLIKKTNKNYLYAASGRISLYHIIRNFSIKSIAIPTYLCNTVLEPLKRLNIKIYFYDIDVEDLNPSFESFKELIKESEIDSVLVPSMYGNAANLKEFEIFSKKNKILLIDDAAQSFGASLDEKMVGTFGDAGFFSFSPGKPTAGHLGAFYWIATEKSVKIIRTKHCIFHMIKWYEFKINRLEIYNRNFIFKLIGLFLKVINKLYIKFIDIYNDDICDNEKQILGGILNSIENDKFLYREKYFYQFYRLYCENKLFRIIKNIRGKPSPHKIVIVFKNNNYAEKFFKFFQINKINVLYGYTLLDNNLKFKNSVSLQGKIIELPIENNQIHMQYIFDKVNEFLESEIK